MNGWTIKTPDWLTARPIAHRGLHSNSSDWSKIRRRRRRGDRQDYAIECDIQRTKDGEAVVFHDFTLDRLIRAEGRVDAFRACEIGQLSYKDCDQRIVSLPDFLVRIGGRTPVIVEIKSRYDGDMHLADRAMAAVAAYAGPVCLKSFDPAVLVHLRGAGAACPLGLVAQASYDTGEEWAGLPQEWRASFADSGTFRSRGRISYLGILPICRMPCRCSAGTELVCRS